MRAFKDEEFAKRARKAYISDQALRNALSAADAGILAAHLGGEIIKIRIARQGAGKSSGYRAIVAFRG